MSKLYPLAFVGSLLLAGCGMSSTPNPAPAQLGALAKGGGGNPAPAPAPSPSPVPCAPIYEGGANANIQANGIKDPKVLPRNTYDVTFSYADGSTIKGRWITTSRAPVNGAGSPWMTGTLTTNDGSSYAIFGIFGLWLKANFKQNPRGYDFTFHYQSSAAAAITGDVTFNTALEDRFDLVLREGNPAARNIVGSMPLLKAPITNITVVAVPIGCK